MKEQSHIEQISNRIVQRVEARDPKASDTPAPPPARPRPTESNRLVAKRYTLLDHIGRGQLGDVYRALDEASSGHGVERHVAIQLLDAAFASDADFVDNLRRRYAALRSGSHPNVVELHDFGHEERTTYFVMELLDGATLDYVLKDATAVPLDETLEIIRPVADALRYLHAKAIVYGNLKPKNVFITFDRVVKILDVAAPPPPPGTTHVVDDADAWAKDGPDVRDDVYGLACVSYELLSGRHPFNGNSPLEAQRADLRLAPIEGLGEPAWQALAAGLSFKRDHRQSTVQRFLDEFTRADPKLVNPETITDRRRNTFAPPPKNVETAMPRRRHQPPPEPPTRRFVGGQFIPLAVVGVLAAITFLNYERLARGTSELFSSSTAVPTITTPRSSDDLPAPNAAAETVEPPTAPGMPTGVDAGNGSDSGANPGIDEPIDGPTAPPALAFETTGTETAGADPASRVGGITDTLGADLPSTPPAILPGSELATSSELTPAATPAHADTDSAALAVPAGDFSATAALPIPRIDFEQTSVTVSEGQAAAAIVFKRAGDTSAPASFTWWLGDNTAFAGDDYADLDRGMESFAPGADSATIFIPIVSDTLAEPTESFYVYLGQSGPGQNRLEALARVQVEVTDDD